MNKYLKALGLFLGGIANPKLRADASADERDRADASQSAFLAQQLEQVESEIYRVTYPDLMWRKILPVKNSGLNPGAESFVYRVYDWFGVAKFIANMADDLPLVTIKGKRYATKVEPLGAAYDYSVDELLAAAMSGFPLESEKAAAAAETVERLMDLTAAKGDIDLGFPGFLNFPGVALSTTANNGNAGGTSWASKIALTDGTGPSKIMQDLHNFLVAMDTATRGKIRPDRLVLSQALYNVLATTMISPVGYNGETILSQFLKTSPYIKSESQIFVWYHTELSNAAGSGDRIVAFKADPRWLQVYVPKELEVLPAQPRNLQFIVPMWAKFGGLVVRLPAALRYLDGAN